MKLGLLIIIFLSTVSSAQAETFNQYSDAIAAMNRKFRYTASAQPIGFGPTATLTYGVNGGIYLSPISLLLLEVTNSFSGNGLFDYFGSSTKDANGNSTSSSIRTWDTSVNASSVGLHYKRFVLGSFYAKGGLVYRTFKVTDRFANRSASDQESSFTGSAWGAVVAVGNQWHINYFTIGCDWIGYVQTFGGGISEETYSGATTSYGRERLRENEDAYVRTSSLQIARLYIGASF